MHVLFINIPTYYIAVKIIHAVMYQYTANPIHLFAIIYTCFLTPYC